MARQERPVDPADGPLQALAHELRKLRVEAGNPTYRTLARRTGYSASTLSEAANGKRKPTLDVLLAYVGALNGDPDGWRERWEALGGDTGAVTSHGVEPEERAAFGERSAGKEPGASNGRAEPGEQATAGAQTTAQAQTTAGGPAALSRPAASEERPASTKPATPETATTEERAGLGRTPRRGWSWRSTRMTTVAGLAIVVALALTAGAMKWKRGDEPNAPTGGCPATAGNAVFYARTYGSGTTIRQGPARVEHPLASVPAGCTIGLTGYCAGEPIIDSTADTPDVRWFMVAGGGVLASATVHGNPPAGMPLSHCAGDRPLPTAITLHMTKGTLTAAGRNVEVVGYAAYYDGSWHQIGLTGPGDGDFATGWQPVKATVAAAACLGGEGSIGVTDLRAYPAGGESRLADAQRKAAGQVACLYPTAK